MTDSVRSAIRNTPKDYLNVTLAIHAKSFNETPDALRAWAEAADWQPYAHPAIQDPAVGFIAKRQGFQLVMTTSALKADDVITFDPWDAKSQKTGVVMGNVSGYSGPVVEHVVALIGPGDNGEMVLWTIHAGDPIRPDGLPTHMFAGRQMTAEDAEETGLRYVRCGL